MDKNNQCILEDFVVNGLVQIRREKASAQNKPDPYAENDFVNPNHIQGRLIQYKNSYTYSNQYSEIMRKKLYNDTIRAAFALDRDHCFTLGKNH